MGRKLISTGSPFETAAGYSRAVVVGRDCHVSGTIGYDYATMIMPDDVAAQTRNALETIRRMLAEAGFEFADIVRARYVVTDRAHVSAVFDVLGEAFGDIRPAATMIVAQLIAPEMKVEIDVTATKD